MTAPRVREHNRPPSRPDRLPPRRGSPPSSQTASDAGRLAGFARQRAGRRGLVRSALALAAAACLALSGSLALPATAEAQTTTCTLNTGDLWCGVVTVEKDSFVYGFLDATTGALSDTGFSVGTNSYTIKKGIIYVTGQQRHDLIQYWTWQEHIKPLEKPTGLDSLSTNSTRSSPPNLLPEHGLSRCAGRMVGPARAAATWRRPR